MEGIITWITNSASFAHYLIFGCILLTGLNIPLSIDVLIIAGATLASQVVPGKIFHIFFAILTGCYIAAMIAYWTGRIFGPKLTKIKFLASLFSKERMQKVDSFYKKYGAWTLILGRFIPFGVRNAIFMSAGMSGMTFNRFLLIDALGCTLWCTKTFFLFYFLGTYYEKILHVAKTSFLYLLPVIALGLLSFFLYRSKRKPKNA
jgi:membrane-associated protein